MTLRKLVLFPLVGLVIAACAAPPAEPQVDVAAEEQAIRDIAAHWLDMERAKDAAGVAALFADDGQVQWNGYESILGPAAIQAFLEEDWAENPDAVTDFGSERVVISAAGDMAVDFGYWTNTGPDGDDHGKYITVFRRVNGEWKVDTDISMSAASDDDESGGSSDE